MLQSQTEKKNYKKKEENSEKEFSSQIESILESDVIENPD